MSFEKDDLFYSAETGPESTIDVSRGTWTALMPARRSIDGQSDRFSFVTTRKEDRISSKPGILLATEGFETSVSVLARQ